jgi:hypothetical protein
MRRYVNKKYSPPCAINKEKIHNFFQNSWASQPLDFIEEQSDSPFFLEQKIPDDATETMKEFMLNEKNIREVIISRSDIGACGPDGISNVILKVAWKERIRFMKNIIQECITCGSIFESWKKAKTILIFKKGDQADPQNWRPISITNCLCRVFTCIMARFFQEINAEHHLFSDSQKGFIKKTNGCSEHGILLNELFHDARRNHKDLVVTAIDFTNAFGSVPHELILSTMKQRNFPECTRKIVQDMYANASSVIELRGGKSAPMAWKKCVKQGYPLSPHHFNLCLEPLIQLIKRGNKGMAELLNTQRVRKDYNIEKSTTMRRRINKNYSPPCTIDSNQIHEFFQKSYATPQTDFEEASQDLPFFLEAKMIAGQRPAKSQTRIITNFFYRNGLSEKNCDKKNLFESSFQKCFRI